MTFGAWESVDWQSHQRWVPVAGVSANVICAGPEDGPVVVLVHGLGGRWTNWLENIGPLVDAGHRVIVPDLPGFGASPMPADKISIPGYGRWLVELLDVLDVECAALVGNSMGGFIAAEVAIQTQTLVSRLVLVSAAGITSEKQRSDRLLEALYGVQALSAYVTGAVVARAAFLAKRPALRKRAMWFVARHPEHLSPALAYEQIAGIGTEGFLPALDACSDYPIRDRLPEIDCPTLIVWGADDLIVPVRDATVFEDLIPDARKAIWEDTGHVAMLERPAEFNTLVTDFLKLATVGAAASNGAAASTAPTP
jgi:pimeloyl-ACP methyl ester carboxylesterase